MSPGLDAESGRTRDVLVCGGTGFTAQKVLQHLIQHRPELSLGVTCRSEEKVEAVSAQMRSISGRKEAVLGHVLVVTRHQEMVDVFEKYRIIINCIGPFAHTGIDILKAALDARTDYVDCTGEPGFMRESFQIFSDRAREAGVIIVHACGFDSLPLDLGVAYAIKKTKEIHKVHHIRAESYLQLIHARINLGTFKTIVSSLDLRRNRDVSAVEVSGKESERSRKYPKPRSFVSYSSHTNMYAIPFLGSDAFVHRKTRKLCNENYSPCMCYLSIPTVSGLIFVFFLYLLIFFTHLLPASLRAIIYNRVDMLTLGRVRRNGPTKKEILASSFEIKVILSGKDESGREFTDVTLISGPDPGYVTTPSALSVAAETILEHRAGIFEKTGGVFTPGALFQDTDIFERLKKEQIHIDALGSTPRTKAKKEN